MQVHFPTLVIGVALIVMGLLIRNELQAQSEASQEGNSKSPRRT